MGKGRVDHSGVGNLRGQGRMCGVGDLERVDLREGVLACLFLIGYWWKQLPLTTCLPPGPAPQGLPSWVGHSQAPHVHRPLTEQQHFWILDEATPSRLLSAWSHSTAHPFWAVPEGKVWSQAKFPKPPRTQVLSPEEAKIQNFWAGSILQGRRERAVCGSCYYAYFADEKTEANETQTK